mgnify:CR=1 FL=1
MVLRLAVGPTIKPARNDRAGGDPDVHKTAQTGGRIVPTPPIMWLWRAVVVMPFCNMFAIPCKYYYVVV